MKFKTVILTLGVLFLAMAVDAVEVQAAEIPAVLSGKFNGAKQGAPSDKPLWENFDDPVLAKLVEKALKDNYSIEAARQRIVAAEAQARQSLAPLLPQVALEGMYNISSYQSTSPSVGGHVHLDNNWSIMEISMPEMPNYIQTAQAVVKATYLVDITGRQYKARQAALVSAAASQEDADAQAANLVTLIVQTYYDAVAAKQRVTLIEDQIKTNTNFLELVSTRFNHGSATALDVLQQRQQVAAAKANIPLVRALHKTSKQQLATLVGATSVKELDKITETLPTVGDEIAVGDPTRLMQSRPELRAAAKRIEASKLSTESTYRSLYPTLALSAQGGYKATRLNDTTHGETWALGAVLTIPLYQGGATRSKIDQQKAQTLSAQFTLENDALVARQQVVNALEMEREQRTRYEIVLEQQTLAKTTVEEATKHYVAGLTNYLNVLTAIGAYQQVELSALQAKRDLLSARINLLSALGGKWTQSIAK